MTTFSASGTASLRPASDPVGLVYTKRVIAQTFNQRLLNSLNGRLQRGLTASAHTSGSHHLLTVVGPRLPSGEVTLDPWWITDHRGAILESDVVRLLGILDSYLKPGSLTINQLTAAGAGAPENDARMATWQTPMILLADITPREEEPWLS